MARTKKRYEPSPILLLLFGFGTALASTLALALPAAAVVPTWTTAVASQPAGATMQRQHTNDIACPAAGACVVVGAYDGSTPQAQLFIDTVSGGRVVSSVQPPLPGDAVESAQQLSSVSCWAVDSCVAVGEYTTAHDQGGLIETLHNGIWTARRSPAGTGLNRELDEVACNSARCVATGSLGATVVVRDAGGTWQVQAVTTVATTSTLRVEHPSCPPSGACYLTVVADYGTTHERALFGYPSGAGWHAVYFPTPAFGDPERLHVGRFSCPVDGNCVAFGSYQEQGARRFHPIAEQFRAGQLSVTMLPTPGAFGLHTEWYDEQVSCATVTRCAGFAYGGSGTLLYRLTATGWEGAAPADQHLSPLSASCSPEGACVIAGADGQANPYVLTLTRARWEATTLSLPPTTPVLDRGYLGVIRCVARTCVGAGDENSSDIAYKFISRSMIAVGRSLPTS